MVDKIIDPERNGNDEISTGGKKARGSIDEAFWQQQVLKHLRNDYGIESLMIKILVKKISV